MLIIQRLFYVHIIMHCILNGHYVTSCHWACIYHICLYVIWLFASFPLAIRVYRQIKNVAMVTSLQHIKVNLKERLLLHFMLLYRKLRTGIYWWDILPCSQTTTVWRKIYSLPPLCQKQRYRYIPGLLCVLLEFLLK